MQRETQVKTQDSFKMIGNPDVIATGFESRSLRPAGGHKSGQENLNPNRRPSPFSSRRLEMKPELLRETAPELSDWNLELKAKLLIVEGNIGVGKTTLTKKLADGLQYRIFLEPSTDNPYLGESGCSKKRVFYF